MAYISGEDVMVAQFPFSDFHAFKDYVTFVQTYLFELPFGKGKRFATSGVGSWLLGGWQVAGVLTLMSGPPINFTYSAGQLNTPSSKNSPNLVAPVKILHGINTDYWFDPSSFAAPAANTFGNVGRNFLSGPNFFNLDASLSKSIRFTERFNLELRLEAFGATNTPQFFFGTGNGTVAGVTLGSSSFGQITNATGGRQLELGAKFNF